jgi:ketosteroid isomerase-like protein
MTSPSGTASPGTTSPGTPSSATTPSNDVLEVARKWCRVSNSSKPANLGRLLADDAVVHGLSRGRALHGRDAILRAVYSLASMFAGKTCEVLDGFAQGDRAAVRWRITFSPDMWHVSGMPMSYDGLTICTVRDGRIVELHCSFARWWV